MSSENWDAVEATKAYTTALVSEKDRVTISIRSRIDPKVVLDHEKPFHNGELELKLFELPTAHVHKAERTKESGKKRAREERPVKSEEREEEGGQASGLMRVLLQAAHKARCMKSDQREPTSPLQTPTPGGYENRCNTRRNVGVRNAGHMPVAYRSGDLEDQEVGDNNDEDHEAHESAFITPTPSLKRQKTLKVVHSSTLKRGGRNNTHGKYRGKSKKTIRATKYRMTESNEKLYSKPESLAQTSAKGACEEMLDPHDDDESGDSWEKCKVRRQVMANRSNF